MPTEFGEQAQGTGIDINDYEASQRVNHGQAGAQLCPPVHALINLIQLNDKHTVQKLDNMDDKIDKNGVELHKLSQITLVGIIIMIIIALLLCISLYFNFKNTN